ncbi:MAG: DUF3035 domain-containing protein [Alphaproteobacteria bacterium]|nr:DUF3035 domain-containing protein [Alphaproteobacteria bacterium]MBO4644252.1 DUF3035 domain-containing protein [Alphaproteobacteria bacterium]
MKIFCVLLLLFLTGCGDRYSLDEKRGPDPKGIVTTHPLSLPPDYMLRAPEPKQPVERKEQAVEKEKNSQNNSDNKQEETTPQKTEE